MNTMSILAVAAAALGVAIAVPLVLLRFHELPKFPGSKVCAFVALARRGPVVHRGGVPENTLAAIRLSKEKGASGVELDVRFTRDGRAVLLHDTSVDRTSDGTGRVEQLTFEEVRALDVGRKFG